MKKLTRLTLAAAAIATLSGAAIAAQETYVIDGTHSFPRFSYSHFGYSTQLSRFNKGSSQKTEFKVR